MPASIGIHFTALPDPWIERTQEHRLVDALTIVRAVICGAKGLWPRTFLALPNGIPSHDPSGRVFARLDPDAFRRCFAAWAGASGLALKENHPNPARGGRGRGGARRGARPDHLIRLAR